MYYKRETEEEREQRKEREREEREERRDRRQEKNLTKILAAVVKGRAAGREREILGKLGQALDSQGTWAIGPHSTRTNVHIVKKKDTGQGTAPRRETKD